MVRRKRDLERVTFKKRDAYGPKLRGWTLRKKKKRIASIKKKKKKNQKWALEKKLGRPT